MATITKETLPIADAIAARIKPNGELSARQAADLLGVSPSTVGNWLKGNVDSLQVHKHQRRLAMFLGLPMREVAAMCGVDLSDDVPPPYAPSGDSGGYLSSVAA